MAHVFVSYASQDRDRVQPIVDALQRAGWSVWWDRAISGGAAFDRAIEEAIDEARCIVVVWSAQSVESEWVRTEANEGLERGVLVPVAIDAVRPPLAFRRTQTLDFSDGNGDVEALVSAVRGFVPLDREVGKAQSACVGRDVEIDRVTDAVRRAAEGLGSLLLISGEAGVGKSRLTSEAAAAARAMELMVLTGHSSEMEGAPPYEPLIEHIEQSVRIGDPAALRAALGENAPEVAKLMPELRHLYPDIQAPIEMPPDQDRRYLMHGFGEFLERSAAGQPMLLIFEDLHWADDSTCIMLRHLAGRLRGSPVLLLGTYRDDELIASSPFARTLQELVRERLCEDILLQRLDREAVSSLLESRAGSAPPTELLDLVFSETEGNPFFVEEVYRNLEESGKLFDADGSFQSGISIADTEVPRSVRLVLEQRLERVSEACRKVLTAAAVSGRVFGFELLVRVGGTDEEELLDALDEASAASLVEDISTGREARYRFAHELYRQTLLSFLSFPRRQRLHLRIAEALEELSGGQSRYASEIAHHYYQAGAAAGFERTLAFLNLAGDRALETLAFEDALRQFDLALEVAAEDAPDAVFGIQGRRALALRGAARFEDALTALAAALDGGQPEGQDALRFQRAQLLVDLYRGADALPDIEALLERAKTAADAPLELQAQLLLSEAYYRISLDRPGTAADARKASERAIELAREVDDQRALAFALLSSTHFADYWEDYRPQAMQNLEEARAIGRQLDDEDIQIDAATMSLRVNVLTPVAWEVAAEEVRERLEERRDPIRLNQHLFWMMPTTRALGHFERSVEVCNEALELTDRLGIAPIQYPTFKGFALMDLGRFDEAWRSVEQEPDDEQYRFGRAVQRLGFFLFKAHMSAVDEVFADALPLLTESHALNRVWMVAMIVNSVAATGAQAGRLKETQALLDEAEKITGARPNRLASAELALAAGEAEQALSLARGAADYCHEHEMRREWIDACELVMRTLTNLERWQELVDGAAEPIEFAQRSGYLIRHWRILALRGRALAQLGEDECATADFEMARGVLARVAATIENEAYRQSYLAQPLARLFEGQSRD
jgi:tetratricopeptide (TPR) repeat protein